MKSFTLLSAALAACASTVSAATTVTGAAEGFAYGVTGGGSATAVYPDTTDELVSYLSDDEARVIVLTKTFDFRGTEGTTTGTGCAPWGTASNCQLAIDGADGWCENYEPDAPSVSVSYDAAGVLGMTVASDKTIIGEGSAGIILGKGLRIVSGASNVIIQNIAIEEINPQYVWGGDAITIDDADMVWIDHVTTYHIGRQHIVLGTEASGRVTISNHYMNGASDYSATCDGHHYWGFYFDGSDDMITMKDNYFYYTSGRMPKVQSNTVLHAVNNYWMANSGHAFEIGEGGYVLAEGNVFQNVVAVTETEMDGQLFVGAGTACDTYLGRDCVANGFGSSGAFTGSDTGFFADFSGYNIASADAYTVVQANVPTTAGNTL